MDLDRELDDLFRKPPTSFVGERNQLVKTLRKAARSDDADRVAHLGRPTPGAFAVNLLHFESKKLMDALETAGAELKRVQESLGNADDFVRAKREHQKALRDAADRAVALVERAGHPGNQTLRRRIETTLTLLSANPDAEPRAGRLTADLEPAGFDALSLAPGAKTAPAHGSKTTHDAETKRRAEVRRAVSDLERRIADLDASTRARRQDHERLVKEAEEAIARADQARRVRDDARRAWETQQKELDEARAALEEKKRDLGA